MRCEVCGKEVKIFVSCPVLIEVCSVECLMNWLEKLPEGKPFSFSGNIRIKPNLNGTTYRSELESKIALALRSRGIDFLYEKLILIKPSGRRETIYIPDFYLPEKNFFIEVKGKHRERMKKVKIFSEYVNIGLFYAFSF